MNCKNLGYIFCDIEYHKSFSEILEKYLQTFFYKVIKNIFQNFLEITKKIH